MLPSAASALNFLFSVLSWCADILAPLQLTVSTGWRQVEVSTILPSLVRFVTAIITVLKEYHCKYHYWVRISAPRSVITIVCSTWAVLLLSCNEKIIIDL